MLNFILQQRGHSNLMFVSWTKYTCYKHFETNKRLSSSQRNGARRDMTSHITEIRFALTFERRPLQSVPDVGSQIITHIFFGSELLSVISKCILYWKNANNAQALDFNDTVFPKSEMFQGGFQN